MINEASTDRPIAATNMNRWAVHCGGVLFQPGETKMVDMEFIAQYAHAGLKFDYSALRNMLRAWEGDRLAIDFWCPLSVVDGYGRHALALYRGLTRSGMNVYLRNPGYFVDRNYLPPEYEAEQFRNKFGLPCRVAVSMTVPYDPMLVDNSSVIKIGITQFETDRFPEYHVKQVNQLDHLITTGRHNVRYMKKSGVRVPITPMPTGIDVDFFRPVERARDGKFKILLLGAITSRKNPEAAIRIFQKASENHADWQLTIKTRGDAKVLKKIGPMIRADHRIRLDTHETSPEETLQYYHSHDCLLWPSKGEGVGLPPLEAMSTGMEVVMSNNSGMSDYVNAKICYPIRTSHMEAAGWPENPEGFAQDYVEKYGSVGNWWVPDEDHGAAQLQKCFKAWRAGKGKGEFASQYVRENHTLEKMASVVMEVVKRHVGVL